MGIYINPSEISVVVQGPIFGNPSDTTQERYTLRACESVRKWLPGAQIILSTWKGSEAAGIPYDILLENDDPGAFDLLYDGNVRPNNTNRMIVSTVNGLKAATRPYAMKMRSDMYFKSDALLYLFGKYPNRTAEQITRERVVTLSAANPNRQANCPFAVNDWFAFGLREDLLLIWDVPLMEETNLRVRDGAKLASWEDNIVAEMHIWSKFLQKSPYYHDLHFHSMYDLNNTNKTYSEKSIADNLVLYTADLLAVDSYKFPGKNYVRRDFMRFTCYTHTDWKVLYNKYCGGHESVVRSPSEVVDLALYHLAFFLQVHFSSVYRIVRRIWAS